MNREVNLSKSLYDFKDKVTPLGSNFGLSKFSKNAKTYSNARPGECITATSKISNAVVFISDIVKEGKLVAYYDSANDSIYYETAEISAICSNGGTEINTTGTSPLSDQDIINIEVAYQLSEASYNQELKDAFKVIADISTTANPTFEKLDDMEMAMLLFSDSFYFGFAKANNVVIKEELNVETIKAAFRSGAFEAHECLQENVGKHLIKSKYVGKKISTKKEQAKDFLEEAKKGTFKIAFNWSDEQKMHIQSSSFLDTFVSSPEFESLTRLIKSSLDDVITRLDAGYEYLEIIGQDYINALMVGKPGTGKTTVAYALSAATGLPVYTEAMSHNTDETEFSGVTTIVDGKPSFQRTDFLDAYTNGGIIVLEEVNLPNPSVMMGSLSQAIEYPFIVKENGYKDVRRHPLCVIIGTMNVGTEGSKPLNEAFANRFQITYQLNDPTKDSLIDVLVKKSGMGKKLCSWVYERYVDILNILHEPTLDANCDVETVIANLSLRTCQGCLRGIKIGDTPIQAVHNSLIGAIARIDLQLSRDVESELRSIWKDAPIED